MANTTIAAFAQPLRGISKVDNLPRIFLAIAEDDEVASPYVYAIDMNGEMEYVNMRDVTIDLRYDLATKSWVDTSELPDEDEFGEDE